VQTYNPLGQRVLKTLANGSKEIYHYDESGQLIAVLDCTGTTLREYIYWGNQQIALVNNGTIYYIHNDHLNTPQVITNQSQQVVWIGDYEPFGKVASNANNSIEIFSRFPGQYLDNETGLYYNYFRDYDPSVGRYIESDPIGLGGGINTYAYVGGSPIMNFDFYGLSPEDVVRLQTAFNATVNNMTANGLRHPNVFFNAWGRNLYDATNGSIGNNYQSCVQQSDSMEDVFNQLGNSNSMDDNWQFTQVTRNVFGVPVHTWVEGISSNPSDPRIIADPWHNNFSTRH